MERMERSLGWGEEWQSKMTKLNWKMTRRSWNPVEGTDLSWKNKSKHLPSSRQRRHRTVFHGNLSRVCCYRQTGILVGRRGHQSRETDPEKYKISNENESEG